MRSALVLAVLLVSIGTGMPRAQACLFQPDLLLAANDGSVIGVSVRGCGTRELARPRPTSGELLTTSAPSWLRGGRSFVYGWTERVGVAGYPYLTHLERVDALTRRAEDVATWPGVVVGQVVASPDGRQLAVQLDLADPACYCPRLYVVGSDGTGLRPVAPVSRALGDGGPSYAPDGARLAFLRAEPNAALVLDAQGAYVASLVGPTASPVSRPDEFASAVAFSPDGTLLAMIVSQPGEVLARSEGDLVVLRPDGTGRRTLLHDPIRGVTSLASRDPSWSPDARSIAVVRKFQLTVVDVRTGRSRLVMGGQGSRPSWSTDGRYVAFGRESSRGSPLWILDTRTWRSRPLAEQAGFAPAAWRR